MVFRLLSCVTFTTIFVIVNSRRFYGEVSDSLAKEDVLILDGALGTELEYQGYDVSGKLWSAKYLLEKPQVIKALHRLYVESGADVIVTASYQASIASFLESGLSLQETERVISASVSLAICAVEKAWDSLSAADKKKRPYPLVLGDVGPYAAYLADGSEYTGDYGDVTKETLKHFHRRRMQLLLAAGADGLAIETIPNILEVLILLELLDDEFPDVDAYISLPTKDGRHLVDGTPLSHVAKLVQSCRSILALGVNCSSPSVVSSALETFGQVTDKPLLAYPNSGEEYDGTHQVWTSTPDVIHLADEALSWQSLGAKIVGGCCRTRPADIQRLYQRFRD